MKVVSVGGIANDGDDYDMWLGRPYSQPAAKLEQIEREGGDPVIGRARRQALAINLSVRIYGATEDATTALREALLAALDTETAAVALIVSDDDDGNVRYRYVVCTSVDEQPKGEGTGQHLTATLVTHGETRWRANTAHSETWEVGASGDTLAVTNGGSLAARPVYTVRPTDAKVGAGNAFLYRQFQAVKWPGPEARHYPVDVTAADWDTDALLTATKIYAAYAENNIGVAVDGRMTRRWVENYDTTYTSVWLNLDWAAEQTTTLVEAMGSGDTVESLRATTDIGGFPLSGILQIDDEVFTYSDKDDITRTFLGVTRAAKGSTAAAHTAGDTAHWIQHDIWLVYGGTGYWLNVYDESGPDEFAYAGEDIYKPMFDFAFSANDSWRFTTFGESGTENANRAMTWKAGGPSYGTTTIDDPYDEIVLTRPDSFEGQSGYSYWTIPAAFQLAGARLVGRAASYEPGRPWSVGLYQQGVLYLDIPEPAAGAIEFDLVDFDLPVTGTSAGYESLRIEQRSSGAMECRIDTAYLTWAEYPTVTAGAEIELYDLALTLENVTTGESITLTLTMALDEQLEVDTAAHTVTLLDDGSSQYQALAKDARRREMLVLQPGVNSLKVTEEGLVGVTVVIEFEERSYS